MDTLSRDSNSSGSILPLVGVIAGGLALVLSIVALVKLSTLQKTVAGHEDAINKIPAIEASVSAAATKSEADVKNLRTGIQTALDQVGNEIGTINGKLAKMEESMKKPAPAAGKGGAAAPTGVLNADGTYTVGKGDTLAGIARKFAVKMDSLEAENPGLDAKKLHAGQKIRIPKK
ncbi:MAG TPA: LysM domain-containing protein [Lacunisphaera sp.]